MSTPQNWLDRILNKGDASTMQECLNEVDADGFVYIFHAMETNLYKIGFTRQSPFKRFKQIATSCPHKVQTEFVCLVEKKSIIQSVQALEAILHMILKPYRKNGEWFELNRNKINMIKLISQGFSAASATIRDVYVSISAYQLELDEQARVLEIKRNVFDLGLEMGGGDPDFPMLPVLKEAARRGILKEVQA